MRRCEHCRKTFTPKRSDARYCGDQCRKAAQRTRKADADTASAAAVVSRRKDEALRILDQIAAHQMIAAALHAQAKIAGVSVAFMPASNGVIAVEVEPGAIDEAADVIAGFPSLSAPADSDTARGLVMRSKDVGSVVAREAAAKCREAARLGNNVFELRARPDYIADRNNAARLRNDGARFLGLKGFRCRCGHSWAGRDGWDCCSTPFDTATPDAPRGFPHPLSRINRASN